MSGRRDTWGKPNLRERFLYHTKIGRFYDSFEDATDRLIIKIAAATGAVLFAATVVGVTKFILS